MGKADVARATAWRLANPERYNAHQRKYQQSQKGQEYSWRKQGLNFTLEDYDQLLAAQGGVCAICRTHTTKRRLHVDHDHNTNKIRGLLCSNCNTAIGLLQDSRLLLESAINYLAKD